MPKTSLFIQKSYIGFSPQRLHIKILKRPQYQDCNQPLSLFILSIIIIILLLMLWDTCDYQRLCLYCNSRFGQKYLVRWMCQSLCGASDVRLVERARQMFSFVLFKPKGSGSDWDRTAVPMFGVTKSEYSN